jgi:hypothetical protein
MGTGSVVTVSPRDRIADLERLARMRVARDGVIEFAAVTADRMQMVRLRRLRGRLLADPSLGCYFAGRTDGASYLTVCLAGERPFGVIGQPNGVEDPEDYFGGMETS